jgi:hypothetical protein
MATVTRTETRKRGIIGKILLLLFWIFNGLMAWWLITILGTTGSEISATTNENTQAGAALGGALAGWMVLSIWAAGAIILGLLVLLTPGKTIITETTKD